MKLTLSANSLRTTRISVKQLTPEFIIAHYESIPQNHPATNGNFVQIWQDSQVEWGNPTYGWKANVSGNTTEGDVPVQFLSQKKDYIVGYSVGSNVSNIIATVYLPEGDITNQQLFSTSLNVLPAQDSLIVDYITPDGATPQTFNHWVGLFHSDDNPYSTKPLASAVISSDSRASSIPILYSLASGRSYTVAYFGGKEQSTVAATLTFESAQ
jgi:hypothetical protein